LWFFFYSLNRKYIKRRNIRKIKKGVRVHTFEKWFETVKNEVKYVADRGVVVEGTRGEFVIYLYKLLPNVSFIGISMMCFFGMSWKYLLVLVVGGGFGQTFLWRFFCHRSVWLHRVVCIRLSTHRYHVYLRSCTPRNNNHRVDVPTKSNACTACKRKRGEQDREECRTFPINNPFYYWL